MPCTGCSILTAWVCILCTSTKDDKRAVPRASGRQRPEQFIIVRLGVPTWASEVWGDEGDSFHHFDVSDRLHVQMWLRIFLTSDVLPC